MAPRALVAKVSDKLWQDCVRSLSERVDAIVIDVSEPTQSLKWEIDHLRRVGLKCVFIAERRHLDAWASAAPAADSNKPDSWVFSALAHDRVLVYEGDLPDGGSTFASSLGQLISDAAIGTEKRQISPKNPGLYFRIVRFIRKTLLWGALGLGAGYVGAAIANGAVIWQMQRNDPNLVHLHYPQPLTSIFLDNDFMLDLLFFVLYQDVCEGAWRLERAKELDYLRLEMQIEKE